MTITPQHLRIYVDTNFLMDVIYSRRPESTAVFRRMQINPWAVITSPYTIIEMLEAARIEAWAQLLMREGRPFSYILSEYRSWRTGREKLTEAEVREVYADLQQRLAPVNQVVNYPEAPMDLLSTAEGICGRTSVEPTDAIHLATALKSNCDFLLTSDSGFAGMAKSFIPATDPKGFDNALRAMGIP